MEAENCCYSKLSLAERVEFTFHCRPDPYPVECLRTGFRPRRGRQYFDQTQPQGIKTLYIDLYIICVTRTSYISFQNPLPTHSGPAQGTWVEEPTPRHNFQTRPPLPHVTNSLAYTLTAPSVVNSEQGRCVILQTTGLPRESMGQDCVVL